jgi:hypothetical protein
MSCLFLEIDTFVSDINGYSISNHLTLNQARENYASFGACDKKMLKNVRKPTEDEIGDI